MADDSRDTPVVLSRIYTRTGDDGNHRPRRRLPGPQDRHPPGRLRRHRRGELRDRDGHDVRRSCPPDMVALLGRIQNELFDCGADLATPLPTAARVPAAAHRRELRARWRQACDEYNADLPVLRSFILPGRHAGRRAAAHRAHRDPARRAHRVGRRRRPRRHHQPAGPPSTSTGCPTCCSSWPAPPTRAPATSSGARAATASRITCAGRREPPYADTTVIARDAKSSGASPGGDASSQARKPVSAWSVIASSRLARVASADASGGGLPRPRRRSGPAPRASRLDGHRAAGDDASASAGGTRARGAAATPSAPCQLSSSRW